MSNKPDLAELLAESGGSARQRKAVIRQPAVAANTTAPKQKGRGPTSPITLHYPKQVRSQIKILAIEKETTLHNLVAEALNDLFAKYGKPEIAPAETSETAAKAE